MYEKSENKYSYSEQTEDVQDGFKCNYNTNVLEEKIKALELKIETIENVLNNKHSKQNIKRFEGKTVSRCYRLYEDVQKDFSKFCKDNSNYKVQDILSMALYEYMEKNK